MYPHQRQQGNQQAHCQIHCRQQQQAQPQQQVQQQQVQQQQTTYAYGQPARVYSYQAQPRVSWGASRVYAASPFRGPRISRVYSPRVSQASYIAAPVQAVPVLRATEYVTSAPRVSQASRREVENLNDSKS